MLLTANAYVKIANPCTKFTMHVEELDIQEEPLQDFLLKFKNLTVLPSVLKAIYPDK